MGTFKVGNLSQSGIQIADLDPATEKQIKQYDSNNDGILQLEEATRFYSDKMGGQRPADISGVLALLGGPQHVIKTYSQDQYTANWGCPDWKGDFNIPGIGAGNVRTGRQKNWVYEGSNTPKQVDSMHFLVDCNLIDKRFVEQCIKSATLQIGPKGFAKDDGSDLGEDVGIPMDVATLDGYYTPSRIGSTYVPERKSLAVSVATEDLRALMGNRDGMSFYFRLELNDGRQVHINRNGKPFENFEIKADEVKADAI